MTTNDYHLRRATPADAESLADFNSRIHSEDGWEKPFAPVASWTRDLLTRPHPTFTPEDFTIITDSAGNILSSLNLINQTWTYAGIPFGVGRIELVGTHPDHRGRGLVRRQFEVVHAWSAARGHRVQAITGIPHYYRQFGYEMCVHLGGGRVAYAPNLPTWPASAPEPYALRPATLEDIPLLAELYAQSARRDLLAAVFDEAWWRYELTGRSPENVTRRDIHVVANRDGQPVGMVVTYPRLWGTWMALGFYELCAGQSYAVVSPSVLRAVWQMGQNRPQSADGLYANLRLDHPLFAALPGVFPLERRPYAWYLRVADLPGFINHIAPALEARLAVSPLAGHTGLLALSFYRTGLMLKFTQGKIAAAPLDLNGQWGRDAHFPDHTFLSLVFGWRTIAEHEAIFPDGYVTNDTARALLTVLFPRQASKIWPVD